MLPLSLFTELLTCFCLGGSFGAYLAMIYPETDNMFGAEFAFYYIEHVMASFLCPMILYFNNRFSPRRYLLNQRGLPMITMPLFCFTLFSLYQRHVLIPMAGATWANLNHALCGDGNDPAYEKFQLGKWYILWAEFYLLVPSVVFQIVNVAFGWTIAMLFDCHPQRRRREKIC